MVNCEARRLINRGCEFIFLFTRVEDFCFFCFSSFLNVRYRKYFILLRIFFFLSFFFSFFCFLIIIKTRVKYDTRYIFARINVINSVTRFE